MLFIEGEMMHSEQLSSSRSEYSQTQEGHQPDYGIGRMDINFGISTELYPTTKLREDPLDQYIESIRRIPLLDREQEITLAQTIKIANIANELINTKAEVSNQYTEDLIDAFKTINDEPNLPETEPLTLEYLVEKGQEARKTFVQGNLSLVVAVAKSHRNRGVPLIDLIQEGNIGLMRAVEKFDETRGFKFSTHAVWWIRQAINYSIMDKSKNIRIPMHRVEEINKVSKFRNYLSTELGHEPSNEELADGMGISLNKVEDAIRNRNLEPISLETPTSNGDTVIGELIEDDTDNSPEEAAYKTLEKENLARILGSLGMKEQRVMELRFGLQDGKQHTLREVGKKLSLTAERIRQIENRAKSRLLHPSRTKQFEKYFSNYL